uniref:DUF4190 domain-containing protein n=1 Tax=Streptomyces sp. NBC_01401 TaxID=2903854 RepID=A0AAU3GS20_9ACTN
MALTTTRTTRTTRTTADVTAPGRPADEARSGEARSGEARSGEARSGEARSATREADGLAVASFVLGLLGLLVMNILLGPVAIVMALIALARSTARRGRALLGLALGFADLVVLAVLVTGNGTVSWSLAG